MLNYQIITSKGATVASAVTYLVPVVAIVLGVLALNETITPSMLAGVARHPVEETRVTVGNDWGVNPVRPQPGVTLCGVMLGT